MVAPEPQPVDHLFVYGTLRRDAAHPMAALLAEHAAHLGRALMRGKLYRIDWYPGLVDDDEQGAPAWVVGDLYHLDDPVAVFEKLDPYEDCGPMVKSPLYDRVIRPAVTEAGIPLRAWVYRYLGPVDESMRIASGDFLE